MFGDGAGAGACTVTEGNALKYIKLRSDGNIEPLYIKCGTGNNPFVQENTSHGFLAMKGQKVFKFAVKTIETEIKLAMNEL